MIGLIFVGFNWNDFTLFTEIKLIYDSIILWFISFFPNNPVSYDLKNKVDKDIKETLIQDKIKAKKEGVVTDYRPCSIPNKYQK